MKPEGYISVNKKAHVIPMGKEKTFDYFFRQYYAALTFFAQSIIHNEEDAKDIVQDCFIKLWDDDSIEQKTEAIKSFLYTMVRNRCIDYIRKQKIITKATLHLQTKEEELAYVNELVFAETVREIIDEIDKLPLNTRNILKMYYLEGMKHKEIAEELSATTDAVRVKKLRALKLLKEKLLLILTVCCSYLVLFAAGSCFAINTL